MVIVCHLTLEILFYIDSTSWCMFAATTMDVDFQELHFSILEF